MPRKSKKESESGYHAEEEIEETLQEESAPELKAAPPADNGAVPGPLAEVKKKRGRPKKVEAKIPEAFVAQVAQLPLMIGQKVYASQGIAITYRQQDVEAVVASAIEVCNTYQIKVPPWLGLGAAYAGAIIAADKQLIEPKPEPGKQPPDGSKNPSPEVQRQSADSGSGAQGAGKDVSDSGVHREARA